MSNFVRFLSFYCFFLAMAFGQDYQFKLDGSFQVERQELLASTVNFKLQWNETQTEMSGVYEDNFYSKSIPVRGTVGSTSRSFNVIMDEMNKGVKTITLVIGKVGAISGSVPVSITTTSEIGAPIDSASIAGIMSAAKSENNSFSGLYSGTIVETADFYNRCNITFTSSVRLEIAANLEVTLYFDFINSLTNLPKHSLGTLVLSGPGVNLRSKNCGPLPGMNFAPDNCQILNLVGNLTSLEGARTFIGTYNITDENNGESCTYTMNLIRETAY